MIPLNHFIKHKLKDVIDNIKYYYKAKKRSDNYNGGMRGAFPPSGYETVFWDDFDGPLDMSEWIYGQVWGDFHPDNLTTHYDVDGTYSYTTDEGLILEIKNAPKKVVKSQLPQWRQYEQLPEEFTLPIAVGMVTTKQSWKYGWFEAWIKLPKGTPYWPAFWLSGAYSWPPEIDILEAYSQYGETYESKTWWGKLRHNHKIQPNIHYGSTTNNTKKMYGSWDVPVAKCTERFVQYACLWEEDRIEIYYDGNMVFKCTDPEILTWFNEENAHQNIIINHGFHKDYPEIIPNECPMIISSVKVKQRIEDDLFI